VCGKNEAQVAQCALQRSVGGSQGSSWVQVCLVPMQRLQSSRQGVLSMGPSLAMSIGVQRAALS